MLFQGAGNFYHATGGRAKIIMDGLSQFLKDREPEKVGWETLPKLALSEMRLPCVPTPRLPEDLCTSLPNRGPIDNGPADDP